MANEIQYYDDTGLTLYALIRDSAGDVWNGSSFVDWVDANIGTYDIAMTDQGGGAYFADFPATIDEGLYFVEIRRQAGGSPAVGDTKLGTASLNWSGEVEFTLIDIMDGDWEVDNSPDAPNPWILNICLKDTDNILIGKLLYDVDGNPITTASQVLGRHLESAP